MGGTQSLPRFDWERGRKGAKARSAAKAHPGQAGGGAMALLGIPGPPRGGEEDRLLILTTAEAGE